MSRHNDDCAGRNVAQDYGKHTPGRWQVRSGIDGSPKMDSRDGYTVERADPTAGKPFVVSTWSLPNARLIAAAPELLEAASLLPTHWLESGVLSDRRADGLRIKLHIEGTDYEHEFTVAELRAARAAIAKATGAS